MNKKCPFNFPKVSPPKEISLDQWLDWRWQFRGGLKTADDFESYFPLTSDERMGLQGEGKIFRVRSTPYYCSLINPQDTEDPIRQIVVPRKNELDVSPHDFFDPLGENKIQNRAAERLIHRYSDRVLFLMTDLCSVYCRYCTRKHFTASDQVLASAEQLEKAVEYVRGNPGIREVLFSGGDPLTVSNSILEKYLDAFYDIPHVEIIRIGTRMPVVCPMRIDRDLIDLLKKYQPIYLMTHFNHPNEISSLAAEKLELFVDNGIPVFNQMVLLSGINNHPALIQALSRRLLYLRAKPYYMFQADPSKGTDHLRNSIDDSMDIQNQLWGHISGLMMPNYVVDLPDGGGKVSLSPSAKKETPKAVHDFTGWDGVQSKYHSPDNVRTAPCSPIYLDEWEKILNAKKNRKSNSTFLNMNL